MEKKKKNLIISIVAILVVIAIVVSGIFTFIHVKKVNEEAQTPVLSATDDNSIRVATMNLAAYGKPSMKKVSWQLNKYGIDVVGFQEVDKNTKRNKRDMLGELANENVYPYVDFQKCFDYQGGEYGIGMSSKLEILNRKGDIFNQEGEAEVMAWEMIEVKKGERTVHVYNTHYDWLDKEKRHNQMLEMIAILDSDPCPYKILTGDFNTDQSYDECDPYLENYDIVNGYNGEWFDTFNEEDDAMKVYAVDNIVMTRNLKLKDVNAIRNDKLSDHSMVYAEFEFVD